MKNRKSDTSKYRRRRSREKVNAVERARLQKQREREHYERMKPILEAKRLERFEKRHQIQLLQNLLVSRMFQLDPERTKGILAIQRLRGFWAAMTRWGVK